MPEFILNTDGQVAAPKGVALIWPHPLRFEQLSIFVQGYIEALFFTSGEDSGTMQNEAGDAVDVGFSDLAPATLLTILKDCAAFQDQAHALLEAAYERDYDAAQAGRDFWYTRCGHGVGYWDREALDPQSPEWDATRIPLDQWSAETRAVVEKLKAESLGQRLTDLCGHNTPFPNVDAYLGADGLVYLD